MIRKQSPEEQIATMQRLIKFGINENTSNSSKPVVEFKRKAANGKTYGIIRESTKYYIMEAPQKDTEILAEDFDYIGGFNNRKENEYESYSKASNALDLKIMAINETVNKKDRVIVEAPTIKADWEDKLTESMRKEIDRFKTITNNVAKILKEDKQKSWGEIPSEHTLPEAPAKNPSEKDVNAPYTQSGVAKGEKDFKKEEHNHQKAGTPYFNNGDSSLEKNMTSDKKPNVKTDSNDLTNEKTYEPDNNIASQHKTGKNPIGIFENKGKKTRLKLTEEQVLAWNDNKDFMDTKQGTHVGPSDPFIKELGKDSNQTEADTDPIISEGNGESVVYDHPLDQNKPTPGTTDVETEDGDPFVKSINEVEADDVAGFDDDLDAVEANDDLWNSSDEDEYEIVPDDIDIENNEDEFTPERANRDIEDLRRQIANGEFDDEFDDGLYENRRGRLFEREEFSPKSYGEEFDDEYYNWENGLGNNETEFEVVPDEDPLDNLDDTEAYNDDNSLGFTPERANQDIEDLLKHDEEDYDTFDDEDTVYENRRRRLSEDKLNVFGKHPAWRKQPMTTPPNKEVAINGAREWDDESTQGEEPYAKQIGDSSPFTDVVNSVYESVLKSLIRNKKKV